MDSLFVIGLPKGMETRLVSAALTNNVAVEYILSAVNDAGKLRLIPTEHTAIFPFQAYTQGKEPRDLKVLVLPYAPIPQNLEDELDAFEAVEGLVERPERGKEGGLAREIRLTMVFLTASSRAFRRNIFRKSRSLHRSILVRLQRAIIGFLSLMAHWKRVMTFQSIGAFF
jgi:hypothetical protein